MFGALDDAWRRSPLRRRYLALAPRERLLVAALIAVVAVALAGALADSLRDFRTGAVSRYAREHADLRWMRANRNAAGLRDGPAIGAASMSTINATAKDFDLALLRIDPEGEGFSVQIEAKPFEKVLLWSHALETRHGMTITSATMDAYDPGIVNARFSIR